MSVAHCQTCGARWTDADTQTSYYFTSASHPQPSWLASADTYTSAAAIIAAGEAILTCPLDGALDRGALGYAADTFTPGGASTARGDDRYTTGDETSPTRGDVTPSVPPLSERGELP